VAVAGIADAICVGVDPKFILVTETFASLRMVAVHVDPLECAVFPPVGQGVALAYPN
jgi:hypothetical protein